MQDNNAMKPYGGPAAPGGGPTAFSVDATGRSVQTDSYGRPVAGGGPGPVIGAPVMAVDARAKAPREWETPTAECSPDCCLSAFCSCVFMHGMAENLKSKPAAQYAIFTGVMIAVRTASYFLWPDMVTDEAAFRLILFIVFWFLMITCSLMEVKNMMAWKEEVGAQIGVEEQSSKCEVCCCMFCCRCYVLPACKRTMTASIKAVRP